MNENTSTVVNAIRGLGSEDSKERMHARERLKQIGEPAIWHLIQAMYPPGDKTRHGALKTLVSLADPLAVDVFVETLEDEDSDCRWLAAEGLAALGEFGLKRALELLIRYPSTERLRRALHHVISEFGKAGYDDVVAPVLRASQGTVPGTLLPTAAYEALSKLREAGRARLDQNSPTAR